MFCQAKSLCSHLHRARHSDDQFPRKKYSNLFGDSYDLAKLIEYSSKVIGRFIRTIIFLYAKWMAIYSDFVECYEDGMPIVEIAQRNNISERSIYRYKSYYEEIKNKKK